MTQPFTLAGYAATLKQLLERGYRVTSFHTARPDQPDLILRHDVDQSLSAAAEMATFESDNGWSSTYFVMLRSEFYNPFTAKGLAALQTIVQAGHEIGLHFDAALYADSSDALNQGAEHECAFLESLIGRPVSIISLHRPANSLQGNDRNLAGRPHTYQSRFFENIGYCSDSFGTWRFGAPDENPAVVDGRALQLLTHPIWWSGPDRNPASTMAAFLDARFRFLDDELARHCGAHQPLFNAEGVRS